MSKLPSLFGLEALLLARATSHYSWLSYAAALSLVIGCTSGNGTLDPSASSSGGSGGEASSSSTSGSGGETSGGSADTTSGSTGAAFEVLDSDWATVIGTGQSLGVGVQGLITTRTQTYNNLTLAFGAAQLPPFDPDDPELSLVPLVEPVHKRSSTYPSAYPANINGETPHTAMSIQVSALVEQHSGQDYVTVHSVVGESGQPMSVINKDATEKVSGATSLGRAYQATLFETQAILRLATEQGKTVGVGAIVLTHGEADTGSSVYDDDLVELWSDYNADLKAITQQDVSIPMLISQQHSEPKGRGSRSAATDAQWRVGLDHPGDLVCSGPKYQYPYHADGVHMVAEGYRLLGEKLGQVYFERVVLGRNWQPLYPIEASRSGNTIDVRFHVPVPPLTWDAELAAPHQSPDGYPEWSAGKGFEVRLGSTAIEIESVEIVDDVVRITCAESVPSGALVGYAAIADGLKMENGTARWGLLRDSDPFVGTLTQKAQANYAVAFELPLE